jgi:hypothetical protein
MQHSHIDNTYTLGKLPATSHREALMIHLLQINFYSLNWIKSFAPTNSIATNPESSVTPTNFLHYYPDLRLRESSSTSRQHEGLQQRVAMKPKMCRRRGGSVTLLAGADVAGGYRWRGLAERWPSTWTRVEAASDVDLRRGGQQRGDMGGSSGRPAQAPGAEVAAAGF